MKNVWPWQLRQTPRDCLGSCVAAHVLRMWFPLLQHLMEKSTPTVIIPRHLRNTLALCTRQNQTHIRDFPVRCLNHMDDTDILISEVAEQLKRLNPHKSPGPDGIHSLVLKELATVIAAPVTRLFNVSLNAGQLPAEWKTAIISPMHKTGSRRAPA